MNLSGNTQQRKVDSLNYYSRKVDITTYWDGGSYYVFTVYSHVDKEVKEIVKLEGDIDEASNRFEELKNKYILNY